MDRKGRASQTRTKEESTHDSTGCVHSLGACLSACRAPTVTLRIREGTASLQGAVGEGGRGSIWRTLNALQRVLDLILQATGLTWDLTLDRGNSQMRG